jgi:hypothetical protein
MKINQQIIFWPALTLMSFCLASVNAQEIILYKINDAERPFVISRHFQYSTNEEIHEIIMANRFL